MTIDALFSLVDRMLREQQPDYRAYYQEMSRLHADLDPLEQAHTAPGVRLADALHDYADGRAGAADVAILLRGVCRTTGHSMCVPSTLWSVIEREVTDPGLLRLGSCTDTLVRVDAAVWHPEWLAHTERIDALEKRSFDQPSPGDGVLYAMTGWSSYQSEAQKEAVHAFLFAAPGSTTIVTMPTGSGKSLCIQLPAWSDSRGGTISGGTTLVVVPTVALAIDQQKRAYKYFKHAPNEEYRPQYWIGGMPQERRATVRRGLTNGTLPLLFLSPEALIGSELHSIALQAARSGKLRRFVVDEAHIIDAWGAGFRTDFQFLSTYRRQLLDASGGALRTLLLTATLTNSAEHLLKKLFVEQGRLTTVHAGRLRPEIGYWMHLSRSRFERQRNVLEAVRYLPRPLILYTTTPDDAERWVKDLRQVGYRRVKSFTGNTTAVDREARIKEWGEGRIDIMCATSAFGLGIDKRDVRTVIHACVPENVDRFYQEVGRGGRDSCSAISLLCAEPDDFGMADSIVRGSRITSDKALPRWLGMLNSGRLSEGRGDAMTLDLDAPPIDRSDIRRSPKNRDWNEHTLLLAQRARLVTIEDARADIGDIQEVALGELAPLWMSVHLSEPDKAYDANYIREAFEAARATELDDLLAALKDMRKLLHDTAGDSPKRCIAAALAGSYPDTAFACGGCPACRAQSISPYAQPLHTSAELYCSPVDAALLSGDLAPLLLPGRPLTLQYSLPLKTSAVADTLAVLLRLGVQQIILPEVLLGADWQLLSRRASEHSHTPHRFVSAAQVVEHGAEALFALPTAAIYPSDEEDADQLHVVLKAVALDLPLINIVPRLLHLRSERGRLSDHFLVHDLALLDQIANKANFDLF